MQMPEYQWITSDSILTAASSLCENSPDGFVSAKELLKLRQSFPEDQVRFLADQAKLRKLASSRFPLAPDMLFTTKGLQQTTDAAIAKYKAELLVRLAPQTQHAIDLCCGMGGDLQAMAHQFNVIGIDLDPLLCQVAKHNASIQSNHSVSTQNIAAENFNLDTDWIHIDPDRRSDGVRHTDIQAFTPPLSTLDELIQRVGKSIHGISIKLAPATQVPDHWIDQCHLMWIQSRNECRQQLAVFTPKTQNSHKRSAISVQSDGQAAWEFHALEHDTSESADIPLHQGPIDTIFEPKPALLAANLAPTWAAKHNLTYIHSGVSYFSAQKPNPIPGGNGYRIVQQPSFDLKQLRQWIKQHDIGRLEIKKRGIDLTPEQLRKQLKPKGKQAITLIIAGNPRSDKQAVAYFAESI